MKRKIVHILFQLHVPNFFMKSIARYVCGFFDFRPCRLVAQPRLEFVPANLREFCAQDTHHFLAHQFLDLVFEQRRSNFDKCVFCHAYLPHVVNLTRTATFLL